MSQTIIDQTENAVPSTAAVLWLEDSAASPVDGKILVSSLAGPVSTTSSSTTVNARAVGGALICDATSGNLVITLPAGPQLVAGFSITLRKSDSSSNTVSATCAGSDTIGYTGSASFILRAQGDYGTLMWDGTHWQVVATNGPVTVSSSSTATVSSPAAGSYYNLASLSMTLPPGVYEFSSAGSVYAAVGANQFLSGSVGMSTSPSSKTDGTLMGAFHGYAANAVGGPTAPIMQRKVLSTTTTYYLIMGVDQGGCTAMGVSWLVQMAARRIG